MLTFVLVVGLHQGGQSQRVTDSQKIPELLRRQNGTDQQHRRSAQEIRLMDHICIHCEVLPQAWDGDRLRNLL